MEKPIFFDAESVRKIIAGVKMQTRRALSVSESRPDDAGAPGLKGWRPQYQRGDIPVSYTHLDVYKRQVVYW